MARPKLWENCSPAEKEEVSKIEERRDELNRRLEDGTITLKGWKSERTKLLRKVDEVESKYD